MAGTNWSKVERLKLELRVGVATRLMDRVAYGEIREWLMGEGVPEEALPSDRSMHGFTDTLEYACVMQQRLDSHPELAGRSEPDPEAMGLEPTGGALSPAGFVASARRWLTVRLMVSEQTYKVYDHAAMMADRFEERLLMELESACNDREALAEDLARAASDRVAGGSDGEVDANKKSPVWAEVKGMERHLLEAAAMLPDVDPEDLQREAFWMARRNRLAGDPRLLKPAVFARLVGQMLRMLKEARSGEGAGPSGPGGRRGVATEGTKGTQRGGGMGFAAARPAAPVMSGAGVAAGQAMAAAQPAGLRADSAGFGMGQGGVHKNGMATEGTERTQRGGTVAAQPAGLRADSAGFGSAQDGRYKSGVATEGTKGTQRGGGMGFAAARPAAPVMSGASAASGVAAQPAGLRADSAGFGASSGVASGGQEVGDGMDSAGLCTDSAGFGSAQRGSAKGGVATEGTEGTQRGDGMAVAAVRPVATVMSGAGAASGVGARSAGLRADSAGFGATTRKTEATGRGPARKARRAMPLSVPTQVRPMEPAAYVAAFHAAARADGKGRLGDVPPVLIAQAQAEGLSPQEAVFRVRMDRIRACAGGFDPASKALDRLEWARKGVGRGSL